MNLKISEIDLDKAQPSDNIPVECSHCLSTFFLKSGRIKAIRKIPKRKEGEYCSRLCRSTAKRLKISDVKKVFEENECILLADEYVNSSTKMDYICKCGKKHSVNFNNFQNGKNKCPECATLSRSLKNRKPFTEIKTRIKELENLTLLTTEEEYYASGPCNGERKIKLICKNGHEIERMVSNLDKNYGCKQCFLDSNKGENHPLWVHGRSEEHRLDRDNYKGFTKEWKKQVIQRDGYKCVLCGSRKEIIGHHLNGYNWDVENRYNVDNGVTLCLTHHKEFHSQYGIGNNTKEQFEEFSEQKEAEDKIILLDLTDWVI